MLGDLLAGSSTAQAEPELDDDEGVDLDLPPLPLPAFEPNRAEEMQEVDDQIAAAVTTSPPVPTAGGRLIDDSTDEYALPPHISAVDAVTLRRMAEWWLKEDPDIMRDLDLQVRELGPGATDAEIITRIERGWSTTETPYHYFLDTARIRGAVEGRAAYVEATIRRLSLMFAKEERWRRARADMGLSW